MKHRIPFSRLGLRAAAIAVFTLPLLACSNPLGIGTYVDNKLGSTKCPTSDIAGQLSSVTRVRGDGGNFADLAYSATLNNLTGTCDVEDDGVLVTLNVTVLAQIGPAAPERSANFPYFVAVISPGNRVIAKKVLDNNLTFAPNQQRTGATDTLTEHIPLKDPKNATDYHVFVGFQLSEAELAYNRAHGGP